MDTRVKPAYDDSVDAAYAARTEFVGSLGHPDNVCH
jgi:hypothetical protein